MTKKERFLLSLKKYLEKHKIKNIEKIINKYSNLIDNKLKKGEKISAIIKELGTFESIFEKENKKKEIIDKVKKILIKIKNILILCKNFCLKVFEKIKSLNPYIKKLEKEEIEEIENKKAKIKNLIWWKKTLYIIYKVFLYLVILTLFFLLLWLSTIFVASLFMLLDGVKFIGINFLILALIFLLCWVIIILSKVATYRKISFRKSLYSFIILLVFIGLNTGIVLVQYFRFEHVDKVTEKYNLTTFDKTFNLPNDTNKKYYIYFNSWYKNKYVIHYDEALVNQVRVSINYYECFYDFYHTTKGNSLYLSLSKDFRDLISMSIENLKENKIYSNKELSRNTVDIYINEVDYERLIVID